MAVAVEDIDNDQDLDIIVGNNGQKNQYYLNDNLKFSSYEFGNQESITYGLSLADFNGDGLIDIVTANSDGLNIIYYNSYNKK